jgi:lipopolysaccharide biosynthesis protein
MAVARQADAWVVQKHQALAAQQAGQLQEALALYDLALAAAPRDFDCLHMAGVAHFQNGDLERALQLIDRAIEVNSAVKDAHFNRRLVCAAMERREVEAELTRAARDGGWLGPLDSTEGVAAPTGAGEERDGGRTRVIAFYLPQYHAIPENDAWWGQGFTEWTNVRRARPNFAGHWQPHEPGELGYYDLTDPGVREAQARLARDHGIDAFCYYYYWFGGKRLLERPLLDMASSGRSDFPFCVCWANENWTRRWDGLDREILIAQSYSREDSIAFIQSLFPLFRDRRYVTVDRRPLLAVYKIDDIPQIAATVALWRETCRSEGIGEIYLAAVQHRANDDPTKAGFDAAIEFPPIGHSAENLTPRLALSNRRFQGHIFRYASIAAHYLAQPRPTFTQLRGVTPMWDNTARRQDHAMVLLDPSPELFRVWTERALADTRQRRRGEERLLFVNAWNEWGEGNHLEPDARNARRYLEAVRAARQHESASITSVAQSHSSSA